MIRLTAKQKKAILHLFKAGVSIGLLAWDWRVHNHVVQKIIREALKKGKK